MYEERVRRVYGSGDMAREGVGADVVSSLSFENDRKNTLQNNEFKLRNS